MPAVKTIAVINQKGGVGKTTTVANLGAGLARQQRGVCLVDLDSQSHLSLQFNLEADDDAPSVYDVLAGDVTISTAAERLDAHLCIVPATADMASIDMDLAGQNNWQYRLRDSLIAARHLPLEFVLIDCPPALGLVTVNALAAADEVIIPLQPHFLAMQGLARLLETIREVRDHLNPRLTVLGVVLCMYETVTRLGRDVVDDVREFFASDANGETPWAGATVFDSVIRRNIRLAECPSHGLSIFDYDARSNGAADYAALSREVLQRLDTGSAAPGV
ncbi:MAG: AAA family ATPase [Planctomycetes bacterium]|jgi:chromosome partitioning protein|nr:AAA family ATPase [Planctomycetota bacterium]